MKYVIDLDNFTECLDCLDGVKVNGSDFIEVNLLKEFIHRFPKDRVRAEYTEYKLEETN